MDSLAVLNDKGAAGVMSVLDTWVGRIAENPYYILTRGPVRWHHPGDIFCVSV